MKIENKRFVITGGASGLGMATVEHMLEYANTKIAIFDYNKETGAATVEKFGADRVSFHAVDVTDASAVKAAVNNVAEAYGGIDVCINCAGIGTPAKILSRDLSAEKNVIHFANVINVNLIGSYNVMAYCIEHMAQNAPENDEERGVVINTSSGAAYEGQIGQSAYASSKAALIGLNMPAARELGAHGIRINAIAPGLFFTPMAAQLDEAIIESLKARAEGPRRLGDPKEFADCCAYLITNSYMNADTIRLDAAARLTAR